MVEVILLAVAVLATSLYAGCLDVRTKKLEENVDDLIQIAKLQQKLLNNVSERTDMNRKLFAKYHLSSEYGKVADDDKQ